MQSFNFQIFLDNFGTRSATSSFCLGWTQSQRTPTCLSTPTEVQSKRNPCIIHGYMLSKVDEIFSVPRLAERPDQSQTRVLEAQVSVETRLGSTKTQEMFITQLWESYFIKTCCVIISNLWFCCDVYGQWCFVQYESTVENWRKSLLSRYVIFVKSKKLVAEYCLWKAASVIIFRSDRISRLYIVNS